jgi:hypothetical protein
MTVEEGNGLRTVSVTVPVTENFCATATDTPIIRKNKAIKFFIFSIKRILKIKL